MRIALIAPVIHPVPPSGYGGTERVVATLALALRDLGHDVTLFASGDSRPDIPVRSYVPRSMADLEARDREAYEHLERRHVAWSIEQAGDFDIIHDHTKSSGVMLASRSAVPVITTLHNDLTPPRRALYEAHPGHAFVALSRFQADRARPLRIVGIVPNGVDLAEIPPPGPLQGPRRGPLLFLGRMCPEKGPHLALEVARRMRLPLVLLGQVEPRNQAWFDSNIRPHLDENQVRWLGEVGGIRKWRWLGRARCVLFPVSWPEPFGLVMIEAMACGTPVVALASGAVGEVVAHGVSGWIARDVRGLIAGVMRTATLPGRDCRAWVESRFSSRKMAEGYLEVYHRAIAMNG